VCVWKNAGKDVINTFNTRNIHKEGMYISITPKLKNLEAWLVGPMLATNWHENYTQHFFKLFHGNQSLHLLLSRTLYKKKKNKLPAWSNHKNRARNKSSQTLKRLFLDILSP